MKICICPIGGIKHDLAPTRALKISKSAVFPRHRRRGQLTSDSLERYQIQMGELKFIGKRVVYLAVMLFGVATLVFILTKMIPGDPVVANLSQRALNDPEIVAAYRAKHGLDRPLIVQYIYYIRDLLHFDLGTSIRTSRPVLDDLARCYPATLELALFSIVIASVFGILFGIISAIRRNSILDQIVRAIYVKGVSIPDFWFELMML